MTFMVVDLPAPFGPTNPTTSPAPAEKEIPSTTAVFPKRFTSDSISSIAAPHFNCSRKPVDVTSLELEMYCSSSTKLILPSDVPFD